MPGLFFCAQVEGRASESDLLNECEKTTETLTEQKHAEVLFFPESLSSSSRTSLVTPNHGLAGMTLH